MSGEEAAELVRPVRTEINDGFWAAAQKGRLVVQRCAECGELRYPPTGRCPRCLSAEWGWHEVSGRGELLSYVVVHQKYHAAWADRVPYNVVLVQLDEGPRMFSNVEPLFHLDLEVGMRVRAVFVDEDGLSVPRFVVESSGGSH